ncbi:hypothetical protein QBC37DRAFT_194176 [Rhypophila decipiens]|uniref:Uncharacterized protein n=1 Tax=Rhypophila decipiens TaxID=261697 RepID=A0AAN7B683_9PEZI|nr:hypothetical protein QBC37DRAFT_194176 [Rhypophila decipiens]
MNSLSTCRFAHPVASILWRAAPLSSLLSSVWGVYTEKPPKHFGRHVSYLPISITNRAQFLGSAEPISMQPNSLLLWISNSLLITYSTTRKQITPPSWRFKDHSSIVISFTDVFSSQQGAKQQK